MIFILSFVTLLISANSVLAQYGLPDLRNQITGSDNNVWRAERKADNTITVFRNDSTVGISQPGGLVLSTPALTRLGSTIYMIGRGIDDSV